MGPWEPEGEYDDPGEWVRPAGPIRRPGTRPSRPPAPRGPEPHDQPQPDGRPADRTDPGGYDGSARGPAPRRGPPMDPRSDPRGQRRVPAEHTDPRGAARTRPAAASEHAPPDEHWPSEPPSRGVGSLPIVPTLAAAGVAVLVAFVIGRATAGGGGSDLSSQPAAKESTTTTVAAPTTHTVARGESLLGIASQFGITGDALAAANGITNQNHVFVGQVLTIPVGATTTPTTATTLPSTATTLGSTSVTTKK